MNVDIIIVAASKSKQLIDMTQKAIDTCLESETKIKFNIIVVETYSALQKYRNAKMSYFVRSDFNYNEALNHGIQFTTSQYIALCNNDLIFDKFWASRLIKGMNENKCLSGSPYDDSLPKTKSKVNVGYSIRHQVAGWCILIDRIVFDSIGMIDEGVAFWYSDNILMEQFKKAGIKHCMVYNSRVQHLENKTLNTLPKKEKILQTHAQVKKFVESTEKLKYTFSIILPCTLDYYPGAATDRETKLRRAIDSVKAQKYEDYELIIVADGCKRTVDVYYEYAKDKRIKCFYIPKQPTWAGLVRQKGIEQSQGKYIIYLDSDDYYGENHLKNVQTQLKNYDWVYFDDYLKTQIKTIKKEVSLQYGVCGTSSICHKRSLKATWNGLDKYGHDWYFIERILTDSTNYKKIEQAEYYICHQPAVFDT